MKVCVIIPNWNGERLLPICLGALRKQTVRPDQVILVDNKSTDRSIEVALCHYPDLLVLRLSSNFGFGYAVNRGIETANADLVLLLNNDTQAATDWIEALRKFFLENPQALFCACKILNYFDPSLVDGAGDCLTPGGIPYKIGSSQPDGVTYSSTRKVFGASGGASAFRRLFFEKVGIFDERFFMYLEDVDLSLRAQLQGVECYYVPSAVVYHMEAQSDPDRAGCAANPQTPSRTFWITRNRVLLLAKNYPTALLVRYSLRILGGFLKSFLFHLLKGGYVGPYVRGLWRGLHDISLVQADRKVIQRSINISLRTLQRLLEQC
ncbi:MAG: glycosyltransferase family 2 protein [Acidobacteria bacterium]|nr:glycosyltransferase family 2 protein [Acidobacteriota bacterium]